MFKPHGLYWLWPLAAVVFWTATLVGQADPSRALFDDHHKAYMIDEATVVFISDVGAAHRALFIPGTALTFITYSATLLTERWLRHIRRIPGVLAKKERYADILAVVFGIIGGLALLLLSIFNAFDYSTAHWILTAVFVVCVAISAACQTAETMWLERDHEERSHLRRNAIWKLCIVSIAIAFAIVFGVTYGVCSKTQDTNTAPMGKCNTVKSVAGASEWFIAFLYDAYLFTLLLDLWPAHKTRGHKFHPSLIEADRANILHVHKDGTVGAAGDPGLVGSVHLSHDASSHSHGATIRTQDDDRDRVMRQV
ncbi:hypothetical protein P7C70_g1689, partial [Phenoliferia sp. Uapishka_3]